MAKTERLLKVIKGSFIVLILWSFFHVLNMLSTSMGEWPISSYVYFLVWCITLSYWSYQRLKNDFTFMVESYKDDQPMDIWSRIERGYESIRMRHAFYFVALASVWYILCMGAPRSDMYGFYCDNVMAQIALKYFGYQSMLFDGYSEFVFSSVGHGVAFYVVSLLPLLILAYGWATTWVMYKKRIHDYIAEITERRKNQSK